MDNKQKNIQSKVDWKRTLFKFVGNNKLLVAKLALSILITTIISIIYPYLFGDLIDSIIYQNSITKAINILVVYIFIFLIEHLFSFAINYIWVILMTKSLFSLRKEIFIHILKLPAKILCNAKSGELQECMAEDCVKLVDMIHHNLIVFAINLIKLVVVLYVIFVIDPLTMIFTLILALIQVKTLGYFKSKAKQYTADLRENQGKLMGNTYEIIDGMQEIINLGADKNVLAKYMKKNIRMVRKKIKRDVNELINERVSELINLLIKISLYIVYGVQIYMNNFTIGLFVTLITYFSNITSIIKSLNVKIISMQDYISSIEKIQSLLNKEEEQQYGVNVEQELPKIEFKNVTFNYESCKTILHNINLEIHSGEYIGIVGRSGSGKSTIVKLLCGFYYANEGEIFINDKDIKEYSLERLREYIGVVWQENTIVDGTIRENIVLGNKNVSDAQIWKVLRDVNIHEFVESLDEKLDTRIGKLARSISGGQKQRLVIARALLKNPKILILDEPSSAMDDKNEQALSETLSKIKRNRIIVIISHKISMIKDCDKVAVIADGQLKGYNYHSELMKSCPVYIDLHSQYTNKWRKFVERERNESSSILHK